MRFPIFALCNSGISYTHVTTQPLVNLKQNVFGWYLHWTHLQEYRALHDNYLTYYWSLLGQCCQDGRDSDQLLHSAVHPTICALWLATPCRHCPCHPVDHVTACSGDKGADKLAIMITVCHFSESYSQRTDATLICTTDCCSSRSSLFVKDFNKNQLFFDLLRQKRPFSWFKHYWNTNFSLVKQYLYL